MTEPNKTASHDPAKPAGPVKAADLGKIIPRGGVVNTPAPLVDPDAPPVEPPPPDPTTLPLQTQQEMATGAATLKKNVAPILGSGDLPKPGHPEGIPEGKHAEKPAGR